MPNRLVILCVTVAMSFIAYANAINSDFLGDDYARILDFLAISKIHGLSTAISHHLPDRPVLMLTIWLNGWLGEAPFYFKVVNILIHGLTAFTLFLNGEKLALIFKVSKTTAARVIFFAIAVIFAVHPISNQAVNIVIQRGILLSLLFANLSLYSFLIWLETSNRTALFASILLFFLGLLSKETVAIYPFYFSGLIWLRNRLNKNSRTSYQPVFLYFALCSIPAVIHHWLGVNDLSAAPAALHYFLTQINVTWIYMKLFFLPLDLHYNYNIPVQNSLFEAQTLLSATMHIAVITAVLMKVKSVISRLLFVFFYISFLPESGVFPIPHLAFEHRAYMPFYFFLLFSGISLSQIETKILNRSVALAFTMSLIVFLAACNWRRNSEIDSLEKFVGNTIYYKSDDHKLNSSMLAQLLTYKTDRGLPIASHLANQFPDASQYKLFVKLFNWPAGSTEQIPYLNFMIEQLIKDFWQMPTYLVIAIDVNHFLIEKTKRLLPLQKQCDVIENLLFHQMPLLEKFPEKFIQLRYIYSLCLDETIANFSNLQSMNQEETYRFYRALASREIYFAVPAPRLRERIEHLQMDAPQIKKVKTLLGWYLSRVQKIEN